MSDHSLKAARDFEQKYLPFSYAEQPKFHVTGGIGWLNDPNGFAPYKGEYHLFFQYYPYDVRWGPMHWGHVKTKDFIKWERLPAALAPDMEYDSGGCFSGSAVEMTDGRHLLMYTGVRNVRGENGRIESFQTQCVAVGDGIDYEKYEGNPVIGADMLPEGGSCKDFRDPKIWREGDKYFSVIVNEGPDKSGNVLLYESQDGYQWKFVSILAECANRYGKMWECPDFFPLDGRHVLLVSPIEMSAQGLEFHPGNATVCMMGKFDRKTNRLMREVVHAIDYGLDFYAPQTLQAEDGRRIMIAWMQNWETSACRLHDLGFMGQMTVPRELSIKNGRLYQLPVRELERYRVSKVEYENILVSGELSLSGINGRYLDMEVSIRPVDVGSIYKWFRIYVAKDGEHYTLIRFRPDVGTVKVDRTHSGFPHDIVNIREIPVNAVNGVIKFRVVMDRYSLELFVNDGEQAASFVIYTPIEAGAISFASDGNLIADIVKYELDTEIDR